MRSPVSEQNKKRRAVKAALERHRVIYCSTRYRSGLPPSIRVLVSGQYYDVLDAQFRALQRGATPDQLGLLAASDDQADDRA